MSETTKFRPAEVFHPAEYIEDEMAARGWTLYDVAKRMHGVENANRELLGLCLYCGRVPGLLLGEDGAQGLANAFGIDAEMWSRMDALWQERQAETSPPSTGRSPE